MNRFKSAKRASTLGIILERNINGLNNKIDLGRLQDVHSVQRELMDLKSTVNTSLIIIMVIYGITTILIIVYLSRMVVYPLKKMW